MTIDVAKPANESWSTVVWGALLTLQFLGVVAGLRGFDSVGADFTTRGYALVLHHVLRIGLVLNLLILCYSAGYRLMALARIDVEKLFTSGPDLYIGCFFFGASSYGLAFSVLGLAGLMNIQAALVISIPAMLFAWRPLLSLGSVCQLTLPRLRLTDPGSYVEPAFAFLAVFGLFFFLLATVVFVAVFDPNIWEHYLHYYRTVLASGSTQPNEVWHHFYASKGAGLILMTNVLSDCFGAPVASAAFVISAGVVVFGLTLDHLHSRRWALFGVALFFSYLAARGVEEAAMYKHHGALLAYASFLLWGCVRLREVTVPKQIKQLVIVLALPLAYLGFYLPVTGVVFCSSLILAVLTNRLLKRELRLPAFFALALALLVGAGCDFLLNWWLTGLPEVTPMRVLWAIADQARAQEVFGKGGVEFFLRMNNDLSTTYDWSFRRAFSVLRNPLPNAKMATLVVAAGAITLLLHRQSGWGPHKDSVSVIGYIAALLLPLLAFAWGVQTAAVDRMALYSTPGVVLALLIATHVTFQSVASGLWPKLANQHTAWGRVVHSKIAYGAAMLLTVLVGAYLVQKPLRSVREGYAIVQYAKGKASLMDSFRVMEERWHPTPMDITMMSDLRKSIPSGDRILRLTYDTGYGYALPGEGLISEPTYSVVDDPSSMLSMSAEEVAKYLAHRRIRYFSLNLNGRLFSTIVFTRLFDPDIADQHFSVVHESGGFFILKLNDASSGLPLPSYFKMELDLKRSGVLNYPFSNAFEDAISSSSKRIIRVADEFHKEQANFLATLDKQIEFAMLPRVRLDDNRMLLQRMLQQARDATFVGFYAGSRDNPEFIERLSPGSLPLEKALTVSEFRKTALTLFRRELFEAYVTEFGPQLSWLSRGCDERIPFGDYPSDASCS